VRPRKTDGNFGNVSAGVLFSEVAYQRKRRWVSAQILSCKNYEQFALINIPDSQIRGKVFLLRFDWFDCKQSLWYDWSIACTDQQRERNVVRKKAAVCGEERSVTSLKTAVKETSFNGAWMSFLFLRCPEKWYYTFITKCYITNSRFCSWNPPGADFSWYQANKGKTRGGNGERRGNSFLSFLSAPALLEARRLMEKCNFSQARKTKELLAVLLNTYTLINLKLNGKTFYCLAFLIKVAQSSFQHFPRRRFWCVTITTRYQLMLQS